MTTAPTNLDPYASRHVDTPAIVPRVDPVVYGSAADGPLDESQLTAYEAQGFLVLGDLFGNDEVATFAAEVGRLRACDELRGRAEVIMEPGADDQVRSVFYVHELSQIFNRLAVDERIAGIARQILGSDVYVHQSRVNYKPGFTGKPFNWHSDFETWHIEDGMPRMRALSCAIALTENSEFNGPLFLVPKSHLRYVVCVGETPGEHYKQSLKDQHYGVPDETSLTELVDRGGLCSAKGGPGTVVFFDCNTMHGSGGNISPFPRSNVFMVFNSVHNQLQAPFGQIPPRPEYIASRKPRQ